MYARAGTAKVSSPRGASLLTDRGPSVPSALYTIGAVVVLVGASLIPEWRNTWHMFTSPPNACGHFVLAVIGDDINGVPAAKVILDERLRVTSTGIVTQKNRASSAFRYIVFDYAETCLGMSISGNSYRDDGCKAFANVILPKIAASACSRSAINDEVTESTQRVALVWFGSKPPSTMSARPSMYTPMSVMDQPCDSVLSDFDAKGGANYEHYTLASKRTVRALAYGSDAVVRYFSGGEQRDFTSTPATVRRQHGCSAADGDKRTSTGEVACQSHRGDASELHDKPPKGWENETHLSLAFGYVRKTDFAAAPLDVADDDKLIIAGEIVMHSDEDDYMRELARVAAGGGGDRRILEVGFGMGISGSYIQEFGCKLHVFIEANVEVLKRGMAWAKTPKARSPVKFIEGFSGEVLPRLEAESFEGIFVDPFPSLFHDGSMKEYRRLLRPGGTLAFFLETPTPDDEVSTKRQVLDPVNDIMREAGWTDEEIGIENWKLMVMDIREDCGEMSKVEAQAGAHENICPLTRIGFFLTNVTRISL